MVKSESIHILQMFYKARVDCASYLFHSTFTEDII